MKDFDALKSIWHDQVSVPKISHGDILKRVRKTKNGFANKLLLELAGMSLSIALIIFGWAYSPFKMWTTHAAMLIVIICFMYYMYTQVRDYRRIKDESLLMKKPEDYIAYLKKYKHDRYILNTRKYRIYTLFLSIGLILYFIEIAIMASLWITLSGLIFTTAWIAFCYFYVMKRYIQKEESKLEDMISNLERLQKQFGNQDTE
ncbi:hypothetical protein [Daejeonella oryzae]|uniref:hypothetical protein n=1 Tax=Daejeonella oryzae TaxID=1122943 RepID=UPI0004153C18|nr:hypothetical protein [Daejeonella oryzae]